MRILFFEGGGCCASFQSHIPKVLHKTGSKTCMWFVSLHTTMPILDEGMKHSEQRFWAFSCSSSTPQWETSIRSTHCIWWASALRTQPPISHSTCWRLIDKYKTWKEKCMARGKSQIHFRNCNHISILSRQKKSIKASSRNWWESKVNTLSVCLVFSAQ